jgi:lysophospholipase L1-like esterase
MLIRFRRGRGSRPRGRLWLFRAIAICVGLAPFALTEATLWTFDLGRPDPLDDPFVGFSEVWPLFVLDRSGTRYEVAPAHYKFFEPASFDAVKSPGEFRIFCLGGSTVHGSPFANETAFPAWLQIRLNGLAPRRRWRVINCGGISYATYRVAIVLKEVLRHEPDLIIIYEGHNEFLEERSYEARKRLPAAIRRPLALASRLRTFQVLRAGLTGRGHPPAGRKASRPILGPEVQALLDYRGGLEVYRRDDAWHRGVIEHFGFNLRRMVSLARGAGVPVILVNPVANLETPPFKSAHRDGITPGEIARIEGLCEEARGRYDKNLPAAIGRLERAVRIDDRHAGLHYNLATCYRRLGRVDDARREFLRAKDEDICPLRILEPMRRVISEVADETDTPLLDADALFSARSGDGIAGNDWLVDHVHPSFAGHQMLANALADLLADAGYLENPPGPVPEVERRYRKHFEALGPAYFLTGQKRLQNQRLWTEGRGNLVRRRPAWTGPTRPAKR